MAEDSGKIVKPQMQGLLRDQIKKSLWLTLFTCTVGGILFQILFCEARKKRTAEFYKNYDIEKEFNRMRRKGLFDSCPAIADEDEEEDDKET